MLPENFPREIQRKILVGSFSRNYSHSREWPDTKISLFMLEEDKIFIIPSKKLRNLLIIINGYFWSVNFFTDINEKLCKKIKIFMIQKGNLHEFTPESSKYCLVLLHKISNTSRKFPGWNSREISAYPVISRFPGMKILFPKAYP